LPAAQLPISVGYNSSPTDIPLCSTGVSKLSKALSHPVGFGFQRILAPGQSFL
jgi:hypothetical protein